MSALCLECEGRGRAEWGGKGGVAFCPPGLISIFLLLGILYAGE